MGLFTRDQIEKINKVAEKSKELAEFKTSTTKVKGVNNNIQTMSQNVIDYFKDSPAILIENVNQLHDYITHMIEVGIGGIDTETTGLDRIKDTIVGASLYYPGGVECYIPMKHLVPIFDEPYKGQLTYEEVGQEFNRFVDAGTKMIFANADFDLSMMYKDLKVDMNDICYYDVILAWRCLKEDERDNALKVLYNKYVLKGQGDPKKFSDFFTPQLFPYCKPTVAKLYAANDAKITYDLFKWQLPYVTKDHPKCKRNHLEAIADLVWNVEFPLIKVCQNMHRTGMYLDKEIASSLVTRYNQKISHEKEILADMVDEVLEKSSYHPSPMQKVPFKTGKEFSATSTMHVKHLVYTVMGLPQGKKGAKTDKDVLGEFNLPVTNQILKVRSLNTLISTFVEKLPKATTPDSRIHCQFRQIGAATGRMCIAKGTPVLLQDEYKNIEDIVPGDKVQCLSISEYTGPNVVVRKVRTLWHTGYRRCVKVTFKSTSNLPDIEITCTPEHMFLTQSGWISADQLNGGCFVITSTLNNTYHFHSIESISELQDVYDIEVDGVHNFFVNDICVHNSSAEPNLQNVPSHAEDIRHMFRATPGYVMLSSDYSAQEPRITAFVSNDPKMIQSFKDDRDIYASIASIAFNVPYEKCLEFHPETGEYQPEGKARRGEAKFVVLGICYGRSVPSIGEQLYGTRDDMTEEEKTKEAQKVFDSVMNSFPNLRSLMISSQQKAKKYGYTETILGRRRHLPDMQLPEFEFKAMKNYVNPDIDPLDITTLQDKSTIPDRIIKQLTDEFSGYKYFGQIARRTRELYEEGIRVINNRQKIGDSTRQVVNCVDFDTEILTTHGWKTYDQVHSSDEILSYSLDLHELVRDEVLDIYLYPEEYETFQFESDCISAVSTPNHRWVYKDSRKHDQICFTEDVVRSWNQYSLLCIADNRFSSNIEWSRNMLKFLGYFLLFGSVETDSNVALHISTKNTQDFVAYHDLLSSLHQLNLVYTADNDDKFNRHLYLKKCKITDMVIERLQHQRLSFQFLSTLSQTQAKILLDTFVHVRMIDNTEVGSFTSKHRFILLCKDEVERDQLQYLALLAGYSSSFEESSNSTYKLKIHSYKSVYVHPNNMTKTVSSGVWCVHTNTGTWIARRNGHVYITGNSIIQGSAADQTKMAILELEHNDEWKRIGGRILVPVHDELVAEVPIEYWKEGGEILSKCMCDAASFLPFPSKCDVTTTLRWYGVEYPCRYKKPTTFSIETLSDLDEDEIKWIQYHLYDLEYSFPVFKNEDGSKPRGDAALGISGKVSDEMIQNIQTYLNNRRIPEDKFLDDLEYRVVEGRYFDGH